MGKKELLGKAVGKVVVNPVVECVDVDGVARRIDFNDLLNRIDVNAQLDRVDVNRLLERVDVNRFLQRVDFNDIVEHLDIAQIVNQSDIGSIMMQSTTGIFTQVLDALRTRVIVIDLVLLRLRVSIFRFRRWKDTKGTLPLAPGEVDNDYEYCPSHWTEKAMAVQGRHAGFCARGIAVFIDAAYLTLSFAVIIVVIRLYSILLLGESTEDILININQGSIWTIINREHAWAFILYTSYYFFYFFLCSLLTGQTAGMSIFGIKLVDNRTGSEVSTSQAMVRTLILPFSVTVVPLLFLVGVFRRDGRMLHDICSGTAVVYRWNARLANLREQSERANEARMEKERRRPSLRASMKPSVTVTEQVEVRPSESLRKRR